MKMFLFIDFLKNKINYIDRGSNQGQKVDGKITLTLYRRAILPSTGIKEKNIFTLNKT